MAQDILPDKESELHDFATRFVAQATANPTAVGLTAADATLLQSHYDSWSAAVEAAKKAATDADAAQKHKEEEKAALKPLLRTMAKKVNAVPGIADATRAQLGLKGRTTPRGRIPVPSTRPHGILVEARGLRHVLRWTDEGGTSRARPSDVAGCELWLKIGDTPPLDLTGCSFVGMFTKGTASHQFAAADAGKPVYWMLRWVNKRGETGPLGPCVIGRVNE